MNNKFKKKVYQYLILGIGFSGTTALGMSYIPKDVYAQEIAINGDVSEINKDRIKIQVPAEYMKATNTGYLMEVLKDDGNWVPIGVERKVKKTKEFSPYIFLPDEQGELIISNVFWEQLQGIPKSEMRFIDISLTQLQNYQPIQVSNYLTLVDYSIMNELSELKEHHKFSQVNWQLPKQQKAETKVYEPVKIQDSNLIESREVDDMFSDNNSKDDNNNDHSDNKTANKLEVDVLSPVYQQYATAPNDDALKRWVSNVRIVDKDGTTVSSIPISDYKVILVDPKTVDTSTLGTTEYDIKVETSYNGETYVNEKTVLVKIIADDEEEDEDGKGKGEGNTPPPTTPTNPPTTPTNPPTTPTTPTSSQSSSPSSNVTSPSTSSTSPTSGTNSGTSSGSFPQLNDQRSWSLISLGSIFIISGLLFIKKYTIKKDH